MSKTAIVFPGQGSQHLAMAQDLSEQYPIISETLKEASECLGYDLQALINDGPEEKLNSTNYTQPAILAVSVAIYRQLQSELDLNVQLMAGHSLGEYSALVCSGALAFSDALKLVSKRGSFMLEAVPEGVGAMAAILGLEDSAIEKVCVDAAEDEVVSAVNYNSPGQVVIAGHKAAVARASQLCIDAGAKRAIPLAVSVPSHCALMEPAAAQLNTELDSIALNSPSFAVINNVDVANCSDSDAIKDALVRQLSNPVRWSETIQYMEANGIEQYVECGPSKVLAGLIKRVNRRSKVFVTADVANYTKLVESQNT